MTSGGSRGKDVTVKSADGGLSAPASPVVDVSVREAPVSWPTEGALIAGKYRVEGVLGRGGMGVVLAARHEQLGQTVAVKMLLPSETGAQDAAARFLREARAAAGLTSDHVVKIHDVSTTEDGRPFMVMEMLRGRDLSQVLEEEQHLHVDAAITYVLQACSALEEAHAKGIVHRDLKPANLFVSRRSDGQPLVKVLDFGISKGAHDVPGASLVLTSSSTAMGSPLYMSPEQLRDARSVDARSDIWSLGVILHEALTGGAAFAGDTLPAVCASIAADPPKPIRATRPDVSVELEAVVTRCLEKDPAARYASVTELATELRKLVRGRGSTVSTMPAPPDAARKLAAEAPTMLVPRAPRIPSDITSSDAPVSTTDSPATATAPAPRRWRLAAAIGVGAAIAVAVMVMRGRPDEQGPRAAAAPSAATSFRLHIESSPTGAAVFDGTKRLGTAPMVVEILRSTTPRTFELSLDGYEARSIVQADSAHDVHVTTPLVARPLAPQPPIEPIAPVEAPAAPDPTAPRKLPQRTPAPAQPRTGPAASPAAPPDDIRMHR